MPFCLSIDGMRQWTARVSPYVEAIKCFSEERDLWDILLSEDTEIGTDSSDVTEDPSGGTSSAVYPLIREPTKYRILNKGSIMDGQGRPLPIFQDFEDRNNKEYEALFKLFESDHDVELVAENILVAFEYSEKMETKRWIKAVADGTVCNPECIRLVPMFGKEEIGCEISHVAVHRFIREGLIETFVKEEDRKAALESNRVQARRRSIPMYSKTGPPTWEVSNQITFVQCGPAQNVRVLSRGESRVCKFGIKEINAIN